jgi:hypothetical protein
MGLFGLFGKQSTQPYKNEGINQIYELLFCDNLEKYKSANENPSVHPWNVLFEESSDAQLNKLITDNKTESRVKILAYHKLKQKTDKKDLLGVIIEVSQPEGLDVLAAYSDGSARYINYSEKMIVWETATEESEQLIKKLFESSKNVVSQIGPWEDQRLKFPKKGNARLTFLVSDQLYFGEAPMNVLSTDPMGGSVLNDGAMLMQYLIGQTEKN